MEKAKQLRLCCRVGLSLMLEARELGVGGSWHGARPWHKEQIHAEAANNSAAGQMLALLWHLRRKAINKWKLVQHMAVSPVQDCGSVSAQYLDVVCACWLGANEHCVSKGRDLLQPFLERYQHWRIRRQHGKGKLGRQSSGSVIKMLVSADLG